jgi:hypothetical protein
VAIEVAEEKIDYALTELIEVAETESFAIILSKKLRNLAKQVRSWSI